MSSTPLVIQGVKTLVFIPKLAEAIGVNHALVLQQFCYLLAGHEYDNPNVKEFDDGEQYAVYSYKQLHERFFFYMHLDSLRRIINDLEDRALLVSMQIEGQDRTKAYRLGQGAISHLTLENLTEQKRLLAGGGQIEQVGKLPPTGADKLSGCTSIENKEKNNAEENTPDAIGSVEPMGAEAPAPTKKRGRKPIEASPEASAFIAWFLDLMEKTGAVRPTLTETDRRAWAADYDRLVRLDKFTDSQIRAVCSFARKDAFHSTWFWRPTFLRVKKEGVLTIHKILARMKQQGWTEPEKQLNIYVEPPDWKERAGRAYPGYDMSDRNWADLPADFRMKILATK